MDFGEFDPYAWVDRHKYRIFLAFSAFFARIPYDHQDLIQTCYLAAAQAAEIAGRKGISFEGVFWMTAKSLISRMVPPGDSCSSGSVYGFSPSPPTTLCVPLDESPQLRADDTVEPDIVVPNLEYIYEAVAHLLTPLQRTLLHDVLEIFGSGKMSIKEVARHRKKSPSQVRCALNRAFSRIREAFENGELSVNDNFFEESNGKNHLHGKENKGNTRKHFSKELRGNNGGTRKYFMQI